MFRADRAMLYPAVPLVLVLAPASASAQQATPAIAGVWQAENGQMRIRMVERNGSWIGELVWGQRAVEADGRTFKRDVRNPDPALRSRSLEGITILQGLKWSARERRWEGGTLYDGTSGRTVSARLTPVGDRLDMRAYMGSPILGRTIAFRRLND